MAQQERWQMSGSGPELYERYMVPAIFAPWATYLLEQAQLEAGEHILASVNKFREKRDRDR